MCFVHYILYTALRTTYRIKSLGYLVVVWLLVFFAMNTALRTTYLRPSHYAVAWLLAMTEELVTLGSVETHLCMYIDRKRCDVRYVSYSMLRDIVYICTRKTLKNGFWNVLVLQAVL